MNRRSWLEPLRRGTVVLMCCLLSAICPAAYGSDGVEHEAAGRVTGVSASASQNGMAASLKDLVRTNELLSTNKSGRLQVRLDDGSILSIGSESQVNVAKHNASSGETVVTLSSGRLRSRVVKVRKVGTRFQVVTPQARISVVGTDFFLDVTPEKTRVVVYSGIVLVGAVAGGSPVDVAAGQMTTADSDGISRLVLTPEDYEQETIAETALPGELRPARSDASAAQPSEKRSHLRRNLLIGAAIAGGALVGGLVARRNSSSQSQSSSSSQPPIPSIPPK